MRWETSMNVTRTGCVIQLFCSTGQKCRQNMHSRLFHCELRTSDLNHPGWRCPVVCVEQVRLHYIRMVNVGFWMHSQAVIALTFTLLVSLHLHIRVRTCVVRKLYIIAAKYMETYCTHTYKKPVTVFEHMWAFCKCTCTHTHWVKLILHSRVNRAKPLPIALTDIHTKIANNRNTHAQNTIRRLCSQTHIAPTCPAHTKLDGNSMMSWDFRFLYSKKPEKNALFYHYIKNPPFIVLI